MLRTTDGRDARRPARVGAAAAFPIIGAAVTTVPYATAASASSTGL